MTLIKPAGYRNLLGSTENTEKAIKHVKDMFQENLSAQLALLRVTAPMVVLTGTGINDDLNGIERPVAFPIKDMDERRAEVVHSLAKWKRLKLGEMNIKPGRGNLHGYERAAPGRGAGQHPLALRRPVGLGDARLRPEERNVEFLKATVRNASTRR